MTSISPLKATNRGVVNRRFGIATQGGAHVPAVRFILEKQAHRYEVQFGTVLKAYIRKKRSAII